MKLFLGILACASIVVFLLFQLLKTPPWEPDRVIRQHAAGIPVQYQALTFRVRTPREGQTYTRAEAQEDLDQLEWIIEHQYSYRDLKGVDYRACLDAIRSKLGEGITRSDFAYQLAKFLALFGDGHTKVASHSVSIKTLCPKLLPFLVSESDDRLVAYRADRTGFLDPEYPFLRSLDGMPVHRWIETARQWVPDGSVQFVRLHSIRYLRCVELLRQELGLEAGDSIRVELESTDGNSRKKIKVLLTDRKPNYGFWPRLTNKGKRPEDVQVETRLLNKTIGYIRIPVMLDTPAFLDSLVDAMHQYAKTDGLVFDIRGNRGGSRAPLRTLLPFMMADDESSRVVNVAAYRRGTKHRVEAFEARYLYPIVSKRWSDAERQAIQDVSESFQPEWPMPEGMFSGWYYFVISPNRDQGTYYYDKHVVILQDSVTFSAADIFLGAFKGKKNVTLIGLPGGGGSGCRIKYRLRNSHIAVYFSSMVSYRPDGQLYDGKGIKPDIYISPHPEFFIGKEDNVLDRAIQLLKEKARKKMIVD